MRGQTEPGLVAFYDIRPGNWACLFLQPWSLHRAVILALAYLACPGKWPL